ncbi:MAG TPA: hypothetical protein VMJ65_08000 [Solirubrobacteraceae bacterium]|nr:hypothetical protein [Solirubrobacteraceae bacterium]
MIWVLLAVVVVLLAVIGWLVARERRSRQLKEGFGPEYQRVVAEKGDQRAAERELIERRERHQEFELRPLDADMRQEYARRWKATQRHFVDEPIAAVGDAEALVRDVMRNRGYPVDDDFEQRAADISVDHPVVVENYRAAVEISGRATRGEASTEDLRQAMVHFRALFADLLASSDQSSDSAEPRAADVPETTRS